MSVPFSSETERTKSHADGVENDESGETGERAMHLPVEHPEFRYPPSRNPYFKKLEAFRGRAYADDATEHHRGQWRTLMPDESETKGSARSMTRELHVEIGCNAGHVTLEWARRNPEAAYIGIDWKIKAIYRAAEKAEKRGLRNVLFLRAQGGRLPQIFGPEEIDHLYLFFPDPWPKERHWKHRFVTAQRLRHIASCLKRGGIFEIKTDHAGYFEWMETEIAQVTDTWQVIERTTDLHAGNPNAGKLQIPEVTLFERLFIKDGIKINRVVLKRL